MARSLSRFPGTVVGVNARDADPAARRFATVADAAAASSDPIDLAVLCVPAAVSAQALTDAARAGVRAALVCSGGYAEAGGAGVGYQEELMAAAREAGVALLGPNTSGFFAPARSLTASFVPGAGAVPPGSVAVVAASGGVNHALSFLLAEADVGVSLAVGLGNAIDVTAADVLTHLAEDGSTAAVALHVESVADGPALTAAIRALTERVPVVALVVGRNDVAEFARSHTGALATSWRTTRAALRAAGAVLVDDERELVDAVTALSAVRLPPLADPGIGVVTAQAGPGLLHVDGLRGRGVAVPPLGERDPGRARAAAPTTDLPGQPRGHRPARPRVRRGAGHRGSRPGRGPRQRVRPLRARCPRPPRRRGERSRRRRRSGGRRAGRSARPGDATAAGAAQARGAGAAAVPRRSPSRSRRSSRTPAPGPAGAAMRPRPPMRVTVPSRDLDEDEAKTLLGQLGIATPPRRACSDRAEAHRALAELPGPLAVKLLDAEVTHKSDVGGVHLGVRDAAALDAALDALEAIGAARFLVESMAPAGIDLIVGASRDPVFGPVVLVGLGGVVAEALADVAVTPAPLSVQDGGALADGLSGRALLDGFRGGPVADRTALGGVLAALGDLLVAHPEIDDVEINPLRVTADGLLALDAVLTLGKEARP